MGMAAAPLQTFEIASSLAGFWHPAVREAKPANKKSGAKPDL
jgi:hypothetical protein